MWDEVRVVDIVDFLQRGVHRVTVILKVLATPPSIGTLHRPERWALQLAVTIGELTAPRHRHIVVVKGRSGWLLVRAGYGPELACQSADHPSHGLGMGPNTAGSGRRHIRCSLASRVDKGDDLTTVAVVSLHPLQ